MNVKSIKEEDLAEKSISDLAAELSPKYQRYKQIKDAHIQE
jgi:hypothetical protein